MTETKRQRKRLEWAKQMEKWFPKSKGAKVDRLHAEAVNRRIEKGKSK